MFNQCLVTSPYFLRTFFQHNTRVVENILFGRKLQCVTCRIISFWVNFWMISDITSLLFIFTAVFGFSNVLIAVVNSTAYFACATVVFGLLHIVQTWSVIYTPIGLFLFPFPDFLFLLASNFIFLFLACALSFSDGPFFLVMCCLLKWLCQSSIVLKPSLHILDTIIVWFQKYLREVFVCLNVYMQRLNGVLLNVLFRLPWFNYIYWQDYCNFIATWYLSGIGRQRGSYLETFPSYSLFQLRCAKLVIIWRNSDHVWMIDFFENITSVLLIHYVLLISCAFLPMVLGEKHSCTSILVFFVEYKSWFLFL